MRTFFMAFVIVLFFSICAADTIPFYNFTKGTTWSYHCSPNLWCGDSCASDRTITLLDTLRINNNISFFYSIYNNNDSNAIYFDTIYGHFPTGTIANDSFYSIYNTLGAVPAPWTLDPAYWTLFGFYLEQNIPCRQVYEFNDSLKLLFEKPLNDTNRGGGSGGYSIVRTYLENCGLYYYTERAWDYHVGGHDDSICIKLISMNGMPAHPDVIIEKRDPISDHSSSIAFLESIYPNPFNPSTKIRYKTSPSLTGIVTIFNLSGQTMMSAPVKGSGSFIWNAVGQPSGLYVCQLKAGSTTLSRRMILAK